MCFGELPAGGLILQLLSLPLPPAQPGLQCPTCPCSITTTSRVMCPWMQTPSDADTAGPTVPLGPWSCPSSSSSTPLPCVLRLAGYGRTQGATAPAPVSPGRVSLRRGFSFRHDATSTATTRRPERFTSDVGGKPSSPAQAVSVASSRARRTISSARPGGIPRRVTLQPATRTSFVPARPSSPCFREAPPQRHNGVEAMRSP